MDALQATCICECYCGSKPFSAQDYTQEFVRYIDRETLHRAHTQSLRGLFRTMRLKFPIQRYPRMRSPADYAKYHVLGRKRLQEDMLRWQTYPIPRSLSALEKAECRDMDELLFVRREAVVLFKKICCVQGHCSYRSARDVPFEIVQRGVEFAALRDEILLQLMKQTTSNPHEASKLRAWKLIYLCLASFTPSIECGLVVLSYIARHARADGLGTFDSVADVARHCYYAWPSCMTGKIQSVEIKDTWKMMMVCSLISDSDWFNVTHILIG